jgi:hypothetical protein
MKSAYDPSRIASIPSGASNDALRWDANSASFAGSSLFTVSSCPTYALRPRTCQLPGPFSTNHPEPESNSAIIASNGTAVGPRRSKSPRNTSLVNGWPCDGTTVSVPSIVLRPKRSVSFAPGPHW